VFAINKVSFIQQSSDVVSKEALPKVYLAGEIKSDLRSAMTLLFAEGTSVRFHGRRIRSLHDMNTELINQVTAEVTAT
jgi:hypothetical protein